MITPVAKWAARSSFRMRATVAVMVGLIGLVTGAIALTTWNTFSNSGTPSFEWMLHWQLLSIPAVIIAGQALLLAGSPEWRRTGKSTRRPLFASMIGLGLAAACVSLGLGLTLVSAARLAGVFETPPSFVTFTRNNQPSYNMTRQGILEIDFEWFLPLLAGLWLAWAVVFLAMLRWRVSGTPMVSRAYPWLIRGTFLELAVTVPVDVYVRKRTSCYCSEGTAWALILGIGTAGILFGPALVLLVVRRRNQWLERDRICFGCGYDLRGHTAAAEPRCPECGRPFVPLPLAMPSPTASAPAQ